MKLLKKLFEFVYYLIGNLIQIFIFIIFFDFLNHRFKEWMIDFYVATNCNYNTFDKMFILLAISIIIVFTLGVARSIWFKFCYLKKSKQSVKKKRVSK